MRIIAVNTTLCQNTFFKLTTFFMDSVRIIFKSCYQIIIAKCIINCGKNRPENYSLMDNNEYVVFFTFFILNFFYKKSSNVVVFNPKIDIKKKLYIFKYLIFLYFLFYFIFFYIFIDAFSYSYFSKFG